MREWATGIVEDPKVQARLLADARTGKLHPSVMTALMAYALEDNTTGDLNTAIGNRDERLSKTS